MNDVCHSNIYLRLSSFNKGKYVTLIKYGNLQLPACLNESFSFSSFVTVTKSIVLFYLWYQKWHKSAPKNPLIENVSSHVNPQMKETPLIPLLYIEPVKGFFPYRFPRLKYITYF